MRLLLQAYWWLYSLSTLQLKPPTPSFSYEKLSTASAQGILAFVVACLVAVVIYQERVDKKDRKRERDQYKKSVEEKDKQIEKEREEHRKELEAKEKQLENLQAEVRALMDAHLMAQREYSKKTEEVLVKHLEKLEEIQNKSNTSNDRLTNAIYKFLER